MRPNAFNLLCCCFRRRQVDVYDGDIGTGVCESERDGFTDALSRAGYNRYSIVQFHHKPPLFADDDSVFPDDCAFVAALVVHVSLTDNRLCALHLHRASHIPHRAFVYIGAAEWFNLAMQLPLDIPLFISEDNVHKRVCLADVEKAEPIPRTGSNFREKET